MNHKVYPLTTHLSDVLLFPLVKARGVEHVEDHLEEIRDEMEVGFGTASTRVLGERLLVGEAKQQQFDVVYRERVVRVTDAWEEEEEMAFLYGVKALIIIL